jgi:hypothetical protein
MAGKSLRFVVAVQNCCPRVRVAAEGLEIEIGRSMSAGADLTIYRGPASAYGSFIAACSSRNAASPRRLLNAGSNPILGISCEC